MNRKKIFLYDSLWNEHGGAPGLGLFTFEPETGKIEFLKKLNDSISFNCSFLDEKNGILYLCNETSEQEGQDHRSGRIYAYKIDPATGNLEEFFHRDTFCPNPCYVNITRDGNYMLVAHHSTGSVAKSVTCIGKNSDGKYAPIITFDDAVVELFTMNSDGSMGELLDVQKHTSPEPLYNRYGKITSCHPHCAVLSPSGNLVAVCDKGDSHIYMYKLNRKDNKLERIFRCITSEKGCGPRYCVFHPTLPYLFCNHEAIFNGRMAVCTFRYTENGELEKICDCDAIPQNYKLEEGKFYQQQGLALHPNGKYLYSIVNGYDSVAAFSIEEKTGVLTLIQNARIEGAWPRAVAISPNGRFLLSGCLSGGIKVFQIEEDGRLTFTGFRGDLHGSSYFSFFDPAKIIC